MKRKGMLCLIALVVAVAFMPATVFAASGSVKAVTYAHVYKSGKTAYCAGETGIYKVTLKKGKLKKKKRIVKSGEFSHIFSFKKKGKYIYYEDWTEGTLAYIRRAKTSGGKVKTLASVEELEDYVVKGNKIYYSCYDYDKGDKLVYKVMKLNGKKKKSTSVRPVQVSRESNAAGYTVITKYSGRYVKDYLKTPKGTFYLGEYKSTD